MQSQAHVHPDRATPNPATLKFLPGRPVLEAGTFEARDPVEAENSPLAKALMEIPGVRGVFFATDFISVTKGEGEWQHLRPAVLGVVTEFFLSGEPLLETGGAAAASGEFFDAKDRRRRDDQGTDGDPRAPGSGRRRRRHHLQGIPRRDRLSRHEGRLLRLPLFDRDAEARHREPVRHFLPEVQAVEAFEG